MTQNPRRDDRALARRLAELERRLRSLETAPRAGHTSISNGKMLVLDPATGTVIASLAGTDGVDPYGNAYPAGLSAEAGSMNGGIVRTGTISADAIAAGAIVAGKIAAGAIDGQTITGATIQTVTNDGGFFAYAGAPTLGNLIVSMTSAAGTDDFGNAFPQGLDVNQGAIAGSLITVEPGPGNGIFVYGVTPTVTTFAAGSGTWVCPAGITSVKVEAWGGGGGGGDYASSQAGGGGGGGEYAAEATLAVTPGNSYAYVVGAGGTAGTGGGDGGNAGDSTFGAMLVVAHGGGQGFGGGFGVRGGGGTGSTNTTHFNGAGGSDGGDGVIASASLGGAGGGSGGYASAGNEPTAFSTPNVPPAAVTGGSAGGGGGTTTKAGVTGGAPGGGGGGAGSQGLAGAGANGRVTITYTPPRTLLASIAGASGVDPYGNTYPAGISGSKLTVDGVDVTGAWQSYAPAWTASGTNPTLGNGSIVGQYMRIGKTVHVTIALTIGSTTTVGSGTYLFSVPFTSAAGAAAVQYIGMARLATGTTTPVRWIGQMVLGTATAVANASFPTNSTTTTGSNMTAAVPVVPASGNVLTMSLTYQIA